MILERWQLGFSDEHGLTLVELLIALTVLSVGILGAVGMFPVAYQHLRAGGDLTKATALAQQMVELLRDEPLQLVPRYHNADTRDTASFPADDPGGTPPFRGGSALQRWRGDIATAPAERGLYQGWGRIQVVPLDRGLLTITVTVGWSVSHIDRAVQLTTVVGQS